MEAFEYELTKCLAGRGVAVAKILGMPVDPSAMSAMSAQMPDDQRADAPMGRFDPPEAVMVTGRVAELGLAGLGAPSLVDDEADATEAVQVPRNFSFKWLAAYAVAIAAGAAGISWYAYNYQRQAAHYSSPIVAVPEPNRPVPDPEVLERQPTAAATTVALPVAAEPDAPPSPGEVAAVEKDAEPEAKTDGELPGRVVVPEPPEIKKGDPQHDLYSHKVERPPPSRERTEAPRDRQEADALLDEARAETTQMEWSRARSLYERVARGRHRRSDGLLGMASVAWQTNDVESAIQLAQRSLDAGGGESARMMLGHAYLKKGMYDAAMGAYRAVLKDNPESREAQKALREAERQKKRK